MTAPSGGRSAAVTLMILVFFGSVVQTLAVNRAISASNPPCALTQPVAVTFAPANNYVYVANYGSNDVSVIDGSTNKIVATIPVGKNPILLAYAPSNQEIYVSNWGSSTVSAISSATNTIVATIPVGSGPQGIAFDPANNEILVTNYNFPSASNTVSAISTATNTVVATITVGSNPIRLAYDPANGYMYVADYSSGQVSVIGSSNSVVTTISSLPGNPNTVGYDPANHEMYVSSNNANKVTAIDSSNTVVATITVGGNPYGMFYDPTNTEIYVSSTSPGNLVYAINTTNGVDPKTPITVDNTISPGPYDITYNPANGNMYVSDTDDTSSSGAVSVIGSTSNTKIATIAVGASPRQSVFDSANNEIYVANFDSDSVSAIDTSNVVVATITTASCRYAITFHTNPAGIGSITFNGTIYTDSQTGNYSPGNYSASANSPSGYAFIGWAASGGLQLVSSSSPTTVGLSSAGGLTAVFSRMASSPWVPLGPEGIAGATTGTGAGKVQTIAFDKTLSMIYIGSGAGPADSGPYGDGGAYVSLDGGTHWKPINNGLTDHHVDQILVNQSLPTTAILGTWFGGIFRTTDGGAHWAQTSSAAQVTALVNVGNSVYAGVASGPSQNLGSVLVSTDFGSTWSVALSAPHPVRVLAIDNAGNIIYAGLQDGEFWSSTNSGSSWTLLHNFALPIWSISINPSLPMTMYTVAWTGTYNTPTLWKSSNGGTSWSVVSGAPNAVQYVEVDPSNANIIYVGGSGGNGGEVWKSNDGGSSFNKMCSSGSCIPDVRFVTVDPSNDNIVFVGADQGIFKSTNAGSSWNGLNANLGTSLLTAGSIGNGGQSFLAAVQDYGPIISQNGGTSWIVSSSAGGEDGDAFFNPGIPSNAYLFTISGFFRSTDGGGIFSQVTGLPIGLPGGSLCSSALISVDQSNSNNVYLGTTNGIYLSTNAGAVFSLLNSMTGSVQAVTVLPGGGRIYAANATTLYYSTNGGTSWTASSTSMPNISAIALDPLNNQIVFASNPAALYKSTDGGQTFTIVAGLGVGNVLSPPCAGVESLLFADIGNNPMLFVGNGVGLFVTADLGSSWQNLTYNMNTTEVMSIEYLGNNLYVATYGEGFLEWPGYTSTITIDTSPTSGGTVTCAGKAYNNGQTEAYLTNSQVNCAANAAPGYVFSGWSVSGVSVSSSSANPTALIVTGTGTLTAHFTASSTTFYPLAVLLISLTMSVFLVYKRRWRAIGLAEGES